MVVEMPRDIVRDFISLKDLRDNEHVPIADPTTDAPVVNWTDAPLYEGMRIVIAQGPSDWNDQPRRTDLVGVEGTLVNIIITGKERRYVFRLDNGESVCGSEIWWKRL